jgi:hypothetical protein
VGTFRIIGGTFTDLILVFWKGVLFQVNPYEVAVGDHDILVHVTLFEHILKILLIDLLRAGVKWAENLDPDQYGEDDGVDPVNTEPGTLLSVILSFGLRSLVKFRQPVPVILFIWFL